jgi:A/G-specific adenine glycosylase
VGGGVQLDTARIRGVRRLLLAWFRGAKRDLPWRRTRDPYRIFVAEMMLQQTQVSRVEGFYERFLKQFPTVRSLARASADDVLCAWAGMGYYRRARNLHAAARTMVNEHGGRVPGTAEALLALPGVGRYTAGAVASIAFGRPAPVVDGNVARVLCRLFAIDRPIKEAGTRHALWACAEALVSRRAPGTFNQALMDLGATVCVPRAPRCPDCPLATLCRARAKGRERQLPATVGRKVIPRYSVVVGVLTRNGRVLATKRPPRGLLGGLWEFPGGKRQRSESDAAALRRELREELGIATAVGRHLATVEHAYSHFRVTIRAYACTLVSGRPRAIACDAVRWVRPHELRRLALPAATVRLMQQIGGNLTRGID